MLTNKCIVPALAAAFVCGEVLMAAYEDPAAVLAREAASEPVAEGDNIVDEDPGAQVEENIASRYVLAHLSIAQGLTERLSGDLVAAVPDEVAEGLREVLEEARALEHMAIDVGAGEYDEIMAEIAADPEVQKLMAGLEVITATLEERGYYNSPDLEEVVSEILNILSDL